MKEPPEVQFDGSCLVSIKNEKIIGMYDDIFYILRVLLYYMMRTKKLPISSFHDLQVSLVKGQNY
jgi:hypothetical protein